MNYILSLLVQEKNLWETISEGFRRGGSDKTNFLIIYFCTVLFGSILFYTIYKRIKKMIAIARFERDIFNSLCSVNGLTQDESKAMKHMMESVKNSNKFSVFISRKTFESLESKIGDDSLKKKIMDKLFNPDDKEPAS